MQRDQAILIGYAIGNGWIDSNNRFEISVSWKEPYLADYIADLINETFAETGKSSDRVQEVQKSAHPHNGAYVIRTKNRNFIDWIDVYASLRGGAQQKKFLEAFPSNDEDLVKASLRGVYSADGGAEPTTVRFTSTSPTLVGQISTMLKFLDIHNTIAPVKTFGENRKQCYRITISGQARQRYADIIGFVDESPKAERLRKALEEHKPRNFKLRT